MDWTLPEPMALVLVMAALAAAQARRARRQTEGSTRDVRHCGLYRLSEGNPDSARGAAPAGVPGLRLGRYRYGGPRPAAGDQGGGGVVGLACPGRATRRRGSRYRPHQMGHAWRAELPECPPAYR